MEYINLFFSYSYFSLFLIFSLSQVISYTNFLTHQTKISIMLNPKTIAVIGAGPIGCYTAYLLAKQGHNVHLYEEHEQIGKPIQCTGLLTADFDKFFPKLNKESFLINTFQSVNVKTKNQNIQISQNEYLVCRTKFDSYFGKLAKDAGTNIHLNHSFKRKENNKLIIQDKTNNQEIRIQADIVIAADGPLSKTAKAHQIFHKNRSNYYGIQAVLTGKFNPKQFDVYFGEDFCKDFFVWVVPESKTKARVGLCSKQNSKFIFDKFMQKHKDWKIEEIQAGVIPIYKHAQILSKGNCYVVGDAAGQVKATTLGGLIPGLRAAEHLADSIKHNKSIRYLKSTTKLRVELLLHQQIRKAMDSFRDQDWDYLLKLTNQPRIQNVLQKYSRDNPLPLISTILLKEPRFLRFAKYLFF